MREVGRGRTRDPCLSAKTRMKPRITLITLGVDDLHRSTPVLLALVLVACASQTQSRVADMAATPLNDLNVVHAEIPAVLVEAQKEPYSVPSDRSCASLKGVFAPSIRCSARTWMHPLPPVIQALSSVAPVR